MTMHTTPWAMQNLSHNAEVVRQASQSLLAGTGVVAPGDLAVTANGTPNMSVNVAAGSVWIPGTQGSTAGEAANGGYQSAYGGSANFTSQGSYYAYNDASVNLAIAAANGSNPRIDLVVVNAQDAIYSGTNNQILLQVITGTAAASPVAPAIPANCVVLAQIAVGTAVTSITSANITDTRPIAGVPHAPLSFTNGGTAGGTFWYAQNGGKKELWGTTAAVSAPTGSTSFSVNFPTFFTSIQSVTAVVHDPTGGWSWQVGIQNASTSGLGIIVTNNLGSSQSVSVYVSVVGS